MRRLLILFGVLVVCLATAGWAAAGDSASLDGCIEPDAATLAAVDCAGIDGVPSLDPADQAEPPTVASLAAEAARIAATEPVALPAYCREHVNAIFYTSSDWVRLGEKLLADQSPCADYYITLPPLAADKTAPRCLQDDLISALGPRFHPVAEFHYTGWSNWLAKNPGKTWADAAREFQAKWGACGYELWSLNEVPSSVRRGDGVARPNLRLLLDTLAAGGYGMPAGRGIVWVVGFGQGTQNLGVYKENVQRWLEDGAFWDGLENDVWAWGQEVYPDMRYWGVSDTSRNLRTDNLNAYLAHFLVLGESGPSTVQPALDFLEQAYVSLMSAAWPWASGFGNTAFPDDQMKRLIAEQTFAVKHFSLTRPHAAPDSRIAFAYAPGNNVCPDPDAPGGPPKPCDAKLFAQLTGGILDRLASSIHYAYQQGDGSQAGACGPPGDHSWCSADIPNAVFNGGWLTFPDWGFFG